MAAAAVEVPDTVYKIPREVILAYNRYNTRLLLIV